MHHFVTFQVSQRRNCAALVTSKTWTHLVFLAHRAAHAPQPLTVQYSSAPEARQAKQFNQVSSEANLHATLSQYFCLGQWVLSAVGVDRGWTVVLAFVLNFLLWHCTKNKLYQALCCHKSKVFVCIAHIELSLVVGTLLHNAPRLDTGALTWSALIAAVTYLDGPVVHREGRKHSRHVLPTQILTCGTPWWHCIKKITPLRTGCSVFSCVVCPRSTSDRDSSSTNKCPALHTLQDHASLSICSLLFLNLYV